MLPLPEIVFKEQEACAIKINTYTWSRSGAELPPAMGMPGCIMNAGDEYYASVSKKWQGFIYKILPGCGGAGPYHGHVKIAVCRCYITWNKYNMALTIADRNARG
jgi:hypothetical protein